MTNDLMLRMLQGYARYFPLNRGKHRVIRQMADLLPTTLGTRVTTLRFNNLKLQCDLSNYMQRELFFFGAYEEDDCKLWMNMAREASTIFDLGANLGLYSLLAASTNSRATIHAFEPTPVLSDAINRNISLNSFQNIINNRLAVGNINGSVYLNWCAGSDGRNEGMNFVTNKKVQDNDEPATATTLDSYCQKHNINTVDLMKMDVEGGEYAVLLGAQEILKRRGIKCIFLELIEWAANRSGCSTKDVKRILVENGYQVYAMQGGKRTPLETDDVKYGGNAIAIANA